jgi:hypothetical protein
VVFRLVDLPDDGLCGRGFAGRTAPWWLTGICVAAIVPADFVVARGMLRGIKQRCEFGAPLQSSRRSPMPTGIVTV